MIDARVLILAVKDRPCLWHYSDSDYMNKEVREKAWEEVAKVVLPDWDQRNDKFDICNDLKRKWANIRDSYRKEYHRSRRSSGDGGPGEEADGRPRKREYIFSDMLTFLKPVLRRRNRPSTYLSNFLRSGGDTVAESTEDDAATTEDSCQSQSSSTPAKRAREDPGVSTSTVPVVWIRGLQEHATPKTATTSSSSLLLQQRAVAGGIDVGDRRSGRSRQPQGHLVRDAPTSSTSVPGPGIGVMSPPPAPNAVHPQPHNPQPFHHIQQPPPYQQHHVNYQHPTSMVYAREQDSDLSFLVSFLPDMRTMSELQKMDFKIGMMNLMKSIKFPGVPHAGSGGRLQMQRQPSHSGGHGSAHSGGQEIGQNSRQNVVYVTPDTHNEFEEEDQVCGSEFTATVKSERNDV